MNSKAGTVFHGDEGGLVEAQVAEDNHVGTGTECCGALVEEGGCCGAVVEPDGGGAPDPEGYYG